MDLRGSSITIIINCNCGVEGELPLLALRQEFLCKECGTMQRLDDDRVNRIEAAMVKAYVDATERIAAGEKIARVEVLTSNVDAP